MYHHHPLDKITIKGFKSIQWLENFELNNLNVLIGGNGAGKSNFIDFFRLLRAMMELPLPGLPSSNLKAYIADGGGSDDFLFNGPKLTSHIEIEMYFGVNGYRFKLVPTSNETFFIAEEERYFDKGNIGWWNLGTGHSRPILITDKDSTGAMGGSSVSMHIYESISSWCIYHFHDTSKFAPMRRSETINDKQYLRFDASNIAPYLFYLQGMHSSVYNQIIETIRLVTPFFDKFDLIPDRNEKVRLNWKQRGSDYPLSPYHLSDGTIRFICLTTALLQPFLPSTFIIDEPELGLHPYAVDILAELIQAASLRTKIIVSTQSAALVDCFEPKDIVIVSRRNGASIFRRPSQNELSDWLKNYSLGDLWRKNIIGGGPTNE